jgi:membrane associated rhomboid family serine protease
MQLFSLLVDPHGQVAWWAHLGGFLAGIVLAAGMKRREVALLGGR